MRPYTLHLPEQMIDAVTELAELSDQSASKLIREAIEEYLTKRNIAEAVKRSDIKKLKQNKVLREEFDGRPKSHFLWAGFRDWLILNRFSPERIGYASEDQLAGLLRVFNPYWNAGLSMAGQVKEIT